MEFVLALTLLAQQTPSDTLKKLVDAIEKKDFDGFQAVAKEKPEREKFDRFLVEEASKPGYLEGLKKAPALDAPGEDVEKLEVEWKFSLPEGVVSIEATFERVGKDWKIEDLDHRLRKEEKSRGTPGAAKTTPSETLRAFLAAIEKKDYAAVAGLWVEKERKGLTAERIEKQVKKEEARFPGWLGALQRLTLMGAADDSLTEIEIKMEYSTPDGKVDIGAEYIKENGEWLLKDIDDRIEKPGK